MQQPVFSGLKNWNTIKSFDQQKQAADFDKLKDKEDVKWNVVQTYYNLYKLQQTDILIDSNIAHTDVRIQDVTRFKNAGLALNNDVMRTELVKTNLLINKADVESAIDITNYNEGKRGGKVRVRAKMMVSLQRVGWIMISSTGED